MVLVEISVEVSVIVEVLKMVELIVWDTTFCLRWRFLPFLPFASTEDGNKLKRRQTITINEIELILNLLNGNKIIMAIFIFAIFLLNREKWDDSILLVRKI